MNLDEKKISIIGSGYVGLSQAAILSKFHKVTILDIDSVKVDQINSGLSPIEEKDIQDCLVENKERLSATNNMHKALVSAEIIIIALPTNFDEKIYSFNTSVIDGFIKDALEINKDALIVIKSTVPIGYTRELRNRMGVNNIIFSPEFLREGNALNDNLYPSRIIIGGSCSMSKEFANILLSACKNKDTEILFMSPDEAEATKLFSNTFLAMRVAFFNELDSFSYQKGLNAQNIIEGVCLDPRIGDFYNNPSFGYGGYCLPKDSKQLKYNFSKIPQNLISAVIESNNTRINFIVDKIMEKKPKSIGVFRLLMKKGSDNFRESSIQKVMAKIRKKNIPIIIYEPKLQENSYLGFKVTSDLSYFKSEADIIIANRNSEELDKDKDKIFTRDIFGNN